MLYRNICFTGEDESGICINICNSSVYGFSIRKKNYFINKDDKSLNKSLYYEETLIIIRRYDLITDEQYKEMINTVKQIYKLNCFKRFQVV